MKLVQYPAVLFKTRQINRLSVRRRTGSLISRLESRTFFFKKKTKIDLQVRKSTRSRVRVRGKEGKKKKEKGRKSKLKTEESEEGSYKLKR